MTGRKQHEDLAALIERLAPNPQVDPVATLDAMRPRLRRVRRRRQVIVGGRLVVASLLVVGGTMFWTDSFDRPDGVEMVAPATRSDQRPTLSATSPPGSAEPRPESVVEDTTDAPPAASSHATQTTTAGAAANVDRSEEGPDLARAPSRLFESAGGTVLVTWRAEGLTLLRVTPAETYRAEVEQASATEVAVEFENDDFRHELAVALVGGQPTEVRNESAAKHESAASTPTTIATPSTPPPTIITPAVPQPPKATTPAPTTTSAVTTAAAAPQSQTTTTLGVTASVRTFSSPGGTATVTWTENQLTLLTLATAPGYTAELESHETMELKIKFSNRELEHELEIKLVNGSPVQESSDDDSDDSDGDQSEPKDRRSGSEDSEDEHS